MATKASISGFWLNRAGASSMSLRTCAVSFGEVRAEQNSLAEIVGKVANAVTPIAARQDHHTEVLTRHSELLDKLYEIQQNNRARLNLIDGTLAIIERHTGLVKA
jgi:hypothetical protein